MRDYVGYNADAAKYVCGGNPDLIVVNGADNKCAEIYRSIMDNIDDKLLQS